MNPLVTACWAGKGLIRRPFPCTPSWLTTCELRPHIEKLGKEIPESAPLTFSRLIVRLENAGRDLCVERPEVARLSARYRRRAEMDTLTPSQRSERMRRIRGKDTAPEMAVRRLVHQMGFRYRLHARHLPGAPDLILPRHGKAIFVHGCFWHLHMVCKQVRVPKSRVAFWQEKLNGNRQRDRRNRRLLQSMGWRVLVVWECETKKPDRLFAKISSFLQVSAM